MTEAQQRVVELERQKVQHDQFYKDLEAACRAVAEESGIGTHWQDEEGIVFQVVVPTGTFTHYKQYGIERTKRPGERQGSISVTKATELGYRVAK